MAWHPRAQPALLDGGGRLVRKVLADLEAIWGGYIFWNRTAPQHTPPADFLGRAVNRKEAGLAACPAARVPARVQSIILDPLGGLSTGQDSETIKIFY